MRARAANTNRMDSKTEPCDTSNRSLAAIAVSMVNKPDLSATLQMPVIKIQCDTKTVIHVRVQQTCELRSVNPVKVCIISFDVDPKTEFNKLGVCVGTKVCQLGLNVAVSDAR